MRMANPVRKNISLASIEYMPLVTQLWSRCLFRKGTLFLSL